MFRIIHPNRWFFWTIAILVAVGLLLLLFILQARQEFENQIADLVLAEIFSWKTYRSNDLGILVKYPPTWQIEIDPSLGHAVALQNPANFGENISIYLVDLKYEKLIRDSLRVASEQEIVIDGRIGSWLKGSDARDVATSHVVLVKYDDQLYYIAGQAPVFERIVKSIRFLPK